MKFIILLSIIIKLLLRKLISRLKKAQVIMTRLLLSKVVCLYWLVLSLLFQQSPPAQEE